MIGLQVLKVASEGFEGKYRRPFSVSPENLSPADTYMGLPVRIHSVIRANPPAGRQVVATKNGSKITHVQGGTSTPYPRWLLERSINSISRNLIDNNDAFLDALIRFDRRNVKFMTHRAISSRRCRRRRAINNNQELTDHGRQLNNVSAQFIMRANCARKSAVRRLRTPSFYQNSSSCRGA